jgi:NADH-quinone oxidoreductase subunit N
MAIHKPAASILYFIIYATLIFPLFLIFDALNTKTIKSLNKVASKSILIQSSISLLLLSIAGLPPLAGFFPKLITVFLLTEHRKPLIIILILGSLINLFFYLSIVINTTISSKQDKLKGRTVIKLSTPTLITLCSISTLILPLIIF